MIKSYTNIEQSKKLAEILPLESADMAYIPIMDIDSMTNSGFLNIPECYPYNEFKNSNAKPLPCWSLTALLSVLPDEITDNGDVYRNMFFHLKGKYIIQYPKLTTLWPSLFSAEADNPIDACADVIIKLKERNLI